MSYEKVAENLEIVYIEREGVDDLEPAFMYNDKWYYLSDFIRTHNNPWTAGTHFPDYIHAYEANDYYNPLFIELIGDEAVNVYQEV